MLEAGELSFELLHQWVEASPLAAFQHLVEKLFFPFTRDRPFRYPYGVVIHVGSSSNQRISGVGSGTMNLPRKPFSCNLGMSSSAMCQESKSAYSGWSSYSLPSSMTGMTVPGMYLPTLSEPFTSRTQSIMPSSRPT